MLPAEFLRYDRSAIADGEWWRLLTAHVVHLDVRHAVLNAASALVLWLLFSRAYRPVQWLIIVTTCIATIDAGLWFFDPQVEWYVGASGVLHGVAAAGATFSFAQRDKEGWILGVLLLGKLIYEHYRGALPLSSGIPVVIEAHLYGACGGLAAAAALLLQRRSS